MFDPWQDGAGRAILAKRADGSYAASIGGVVMSIPRQVGKTFLIGAIVFALCLAFSGLTVLWTAHRLRTANETFAKMQAFARRRKVKPHVAKVVLGSGEGAIVFHNGSRILFGARERGFGRGFDDVDVEVFDEAQILTDNAIDDMVPATNTAANPLLIFTGTPPKPTDPSEVFSRKRAEALAGKSDDTLYIEFSADRGCDPKDPKQWAKANPSFPSRTPRSAMLRMITNLAVESFVREGLGVWGDITDDTLIPNWSALAEVGSVIASHHCLALDVSPDRKFAAHGAAGRRADGLAHVELVHHEPGTAWILEKCRSSWDLLNIPFRIQTGSPAASFIPKLVEAGIGVVEVSAAEYGQAVGLITDDCQANVLRHPASREAPTGSARLASAVKVAAVRRSGDVDVWARRGDKGDVTPLVAITLALGGVPAAHVYDPLDSVR